MYALILHCDGMGPIRLFFSDPDKADAVHQGVVKARWPEPGAKVEGLIQISDDYGAVIAMAPASLKGAQLIDVKREAEGATDMQLVQMRVQKSAEQRASMDPVLARPPGLVRAS